MRISLRSAKGFTLIEVLIASVILFMAIALVSMAYKSGIRAEMAAEKHVFRAVALGFIEAAIKEELRASPSNTSGEGRWSRFEYSWKVVDVKEKWSKAGLDYESNTQVQFGRKVFLQYISVEINEVEYEFTHLTWV
ncbi:PulJ/GspJ family protein [Alteromonas sp. a30]|uniref:PulJ/GspJ family protein n=1 Tax=Alteromonas sp. a30 TaxID=2730917 RepID=UPI0022809F71|nr:prepilin-type N-terminal cleavage/methylation domain-containing protein [Alteromonas sp. a30]MCY7294378.1 prepilin-type N-terminal cleavage/methylation domain-containing protein [Alteromonas sp. a30]